MAGIQAHAQPVARAASFHDRAQLLKPAAHLAALARHGLKQHDRGQLARVYPVKHLRDQPNARLHTLLHMAAGVKIEHRTRDMRKPLKVLAHRAVCEIAHLRVRRSSVERIGRMRQHRREVMRLHEIIQRLRVRQIKGLHAAAARVAGEELERIRAEQDRLLAHGQIALRAGEMAADMQHGQFPFFLAFFACFAPLRASYRFCSARAIGRSNP